jgi:membrane associated rhomboid family serine protease
VKATPTGRDLLFRLPLGPAWASYALIASCIFVTLPLFIDPARYYPIIGVGYCEYDAPIYWYHWLLTHFVHGTGCGFPPTWFHLTVNTSLFFFHGAVVERVLGSARFALLTATNLIVSIVGSAWLVDGRSHGASGFSWSYGLFIAAALYLQWCDQRSRMFRDPVSIAMAFWLVFAFLGLIIRWHLFSILVSVPFFLAWRKRFHERLHARSHERTASDRVGIAFFVGVLLFNVVTVAFLLLTAA